VPALNARGTTKFLKESMGDRRKKTVDVEGLYMVLNGSGKRWYLRRKAEIKIGIKPKAMPVRPSEQNIKAQFEKIQ